MSMQNIRFYEFDKFRVDVAARSLSCQETPFQIPPKTFDLLLLLIENKDQWVSKDFLMEELWSGFAPDSNNVDQHLSKLRKILGGKEYRDNEAQRQRYIKTERGLGVRLQVPVTEIRHKDESKVEEAEAKIEIAGETSPPPAKNSTASFIVLAAEAVLLLVGIFAWNVQRKTDQASASNQNQAAQTTAGASATPKNTRQEIRSPSDEEAVKRVVRESQMLETLTFYAHPEQFDQEQLKQYWLPATQGGKASAAVQDSINRLRNKKRHYGTESRNEQFDFRYVRIFSPRDYAEVGTTEIWFVPLYNEDGSRVLDRNVRLGPYTVDYILKKIDGVWLLEENSTPRASQYVIPKPSPTQH